MAYRKFAFIARCRPSEIERRIAAEQGISLLHVGHLDPFATSSSDLGGHRLAPFSGAVVSHPAAAARLAAEYDIGVFETSASVSAWLHVFSIRNRIGGMDVDAENDPYHRWSMP